MKKLISTLIALGALIAQPVGAQVSQPTQFPLKQKGPTLTDVLVSSVGTGGQKLVQGGTLWCMRTNTGNVTGSATLVGITLPARTFNALSGFRSIRIRAQAQTAANANNKTINLLFGSTSISILNAVAANNKTIYVDAVIRRTGLNTQQISVAGYANSAVLDAGSTTSAQTETSPIVLQVQMPAATANNDIVLTDVLITGESG